MADDARTPEPPKIKLTPPGAKQGSSDQPPRIKIKPADKKSETARIDLAAAQPPAPGQAEDFKQLTKEELADFYKKSTIRIDAGAPDVGDTRDVGGRPADPSEAMRTTMRVDEPSVATGDTHKVQGDVGGDTAKRSTLRVDSAAGPGDTRKVKSETQTGTLRVDSAERRKSETAKLELPTPERGKQSTARISIDAAAAGESEDVFKKRTIPVSVPSLSPPPAAPRSPTVSMARPKTLQMRPVQQRVPPKPAVTPVAPGAVTEAKKSETARLDLPPETIEERPTTRPKTIRIKRPDGTTARKPLMISRPDEVAGAAPMADAGGVALSEDSSDQPGAVFAIAALLALLVTLGLIYVLLAQSVAPTLPMPGRLV